MTSLTDYHKSITNEIISTNKRVRNLVTHWGEEGKYKELVFKNILKRFLPNNLEIGTGFIIKPTGRGIHEESKQIDIIIFENSHPILFRESDFVIMTPEGVRGIVEIKANLLSRNITQVIQTCNSNGKFIYEGKQKKTKIFNGIFSYESHSNTANLRNTLRKQYNEIDDEQKDLFALNHIAVSKDVFIKHWDSTFGREEYSQYYLVDLAFSFFISNLLNYVTENQIYKENYIWFVENKEEQIVSNF
jgi:hypothetical protein